MGTSDVRGAEPVAATGSAPPATAPATPDLPVFAWRPVAVVAAAMGLLRLLTNPLFDYGGDELYFLSVGKHHLGDSYADQPALVPALARLTDAIAPGSQTVLRLPSVLVMVAALMITALIAREFGGGRGAQVLATVVFATSSFFSLGARMNTHPYEVFVWTALTWLLVRWVRTRDDRLLLGAGVVTAVGLQITLHFLEFWAVAVVCLLAAGPRDLLRRPLLWAAGGIAVLALVPNLIWQAGHGWRHVERITETSGEGDAVLNRAAFVPMALVYAGLVVAAALVVYGVWRLLRSPDLRPYRFFGWLAVGLAVLYIAANGKGYYAMGLYPLCWAAAATELAGRAHGRGRRRVFWAALGVSTVITLAPTLSADAMVPHWKRQVADVFTVYERLPADRRAATAVVAHQYGMATAVDWYGPDRGIPRAYSPEAGYWYFGRPPDTATTVVYVGSTREDLLRYFRDVREAGRVVDGNWLEKGAAGETIWVCSGLRRPWADTWEEMRRVELSGQTGHGSDGKSIR
ncbi:MAG TPA: glycosyltransferase family 39 protein [Thermomonospora sp.]|nr:glycosyltransferase family 39 protein [Thermomonospora sp.]